jgi:hypothetical protein
MGTMGRCIRPWATLFPPGLSDERNPARAGIQALFELARYRRRKIRVTGADQGCTVARRPMGAHTQQPVARGIATSPRPVHCMLRFVGVIGA